MNESDTALAKVDRANRWLLRILVVASLAGLCFAWVGIQEVKRAAVQQSKENEMLIQKLTSETQKQHDEQLDFVKCITSATAMQDPAAAQACYK